MFLDMWLDVFYLMLEMVKIVSHQATAITRRRDMLCVYTHNPDYRNVYLIHKLTEGKSRAK